LRCRIRYHSLGGCCTGTRADYCHQGNDDLEFCEDGLDVGNPINQVIIGEKVYIISFGLGWVGKVHAPVLVNLLQEAPVDAAHGIHRVVGKLPRCKRGEAVLDQELIKSPLKFIGVVGARGISCISGDDRATGEAIQDHARASRIRMARRRTR